MEKLTALCAIATVSAEIHCLFSKSQDDSSKGVSAYFSASNLTAFGQKNKQKPMTAKWIRSAKKNYHNYV